MKSCWFGGDIIWERVTQLNHLGELWVSQLTGIFQMNQLWKTLSGNLDALSCFDQLLSLKTLNTSYGHFLFKIHLSQSLTVRSVVVYVPRPLRWKRGWRSQWSSHNPRRNCQWPGTEFRHTEVCGARWDPAMDPEGTERRAHWPVLQHLPALLVNQESPVDWKLGNWIILKWVT